MKLTKIQIDRIVRAVITELEKQNAVTLKAPIEKIRKRGSELIQGEFDKERDIEREASRMVDDLEKQNPGIDTHKMFLMVKKKLAEQKGVVL